MESLFDLTGEAKELYEMATDEDIDPQMLADSLESVMAAIENKSASYALVLQKLDMEEKKADEIVKQYTKMRNARRNAIKSMKERLLIAMTALDKDELPAGNFTFKIQNVGGVLPLNLKCDENDVPNEYSIIKKEPNNKKIREYLESGNKLDWAEIGERGKTVRIK